LQGKLIVELLDAAVSQKLTELGWRPTTSQYLMRITGLTDKRHLREQAIPGSIDLLKRECSFTR
jgi:hypothetical protein